MILESNINAFIVPNIDDLMTFLKQADFNCLYIMEYDFEEIEYLLSQSSYQQSLL